METKFPHDTATDAHVFESALLDGLNIPVGKYYLADAGYPSCEELLIPYHGKKYHLSEWGCAGVRYCTMSISMNYF